MARRNRPTPTPLPATNDAEEGRDTVPASFRVVAFTDDADNRPFVRWLRGLRDTMARQRILARFTRIVKGGNFGDHRERIAGPISELRIDYGPGYRVYYVLQGNTLIILFGGGTKDTQAKDIETAVAFWEQYGDEIDRHTRDLEG